MSTLRRDFCAILQAHRPQNSQSSIEPLGLGIDISMLGISAAQCINRRRQAMIFRLATLCFLEAATPAFRASVGSAPPFWKRHQRPGLAIVIGGLRRRVVAGHPGAQSGVRPDVRLGNGCRRRRGDRQMQMRTMQIHVRLENLII